MFGQLLHEAELSGEEQPCVQCWVSCHECSKEQGGGEAAWQAVFEVGAEVGTCLWSVLYV